jgi:hypothetical protein
MRNVYKIMVRNLKERDLMGDLSICGNKNIKFGQGN